MHIVVKANEEQWIEFLSRPIRNGTTVSRIDNVPLLGDVYFDFLFENEGCAFEYIHDNIVFVNAVTITSKQLQPNQCRINGWAGFINSSIIEVSANPIWQKKVEQILNELNWHFTMVADEPGMIAPRLISSIINEAYFAFGENICPKSEIDIAMKLGTNYPFGPFEWAQKIGLKSIYFLLKKLIETDSRYSIAPALENEFLALQASLK